MSEKEVRSQISQSIVSRAEETGGMVIGCDSILMLQKFNGKEL
jgi:hypothetical protein